MLLGDLTTLLVTSFLMLLVVTVLRIELQMNGGNVSVGIQLDDSNGPLYLCILMMTKRKIETYEVSELANLIPSRELTGQWSMVCLHG